MGQLPRLTRSLPPVSHSCLCFVLHVRMYAYTHIRTCSILLFIACSASPPVQVDAEKLPLTDRIAGKEEENDAPREEEVLLPSADSSSNPNETPGTIVEGEAMDYGVLRRKFLSPAAAASVEAGIPVSSLLRMYANAYIRMF